MSVHSRPVRPPQSDALRRHGFADGAEEELVALLGIASALGGGAAALGLVDGEGVWFCRGLGGGPGEAERLAHELEARLAEPEELRLPERIPGPDLRELELLDPGGRLLGSLRARLAPGRHGVGLEELAREIAARVVRRGREGERRGVDRTSPGPSFVPGLVHELRNFSFGLSGSLDALEARIAAHPEAAGYGGILRASLERFDAFIEELREYGDPQERPFMETALEPLLREAVAHHQEAARRRRVELRLRLPRRPLPPLKADPPALASAFIRLLDLALHQEAAGGWVELRAQEQGTGVAGHLEAAGLARPGLEPQRIFEPFQHRTAGLGRLALPVARRTLEAHGGALWAAPGPAGRLRLHFLLPGL